MPHPRDSRERRIGQLDALALYAAADARFIALELCRLIDLVEDATPHASLAAQLRALAGRVEELAGLNHDD